MALRRRRERTRRESAADAGGRPRLRLPHSRSHHCADSIRWSKSARKIRCSACASSASARRISILRVSSKFFLDDKPMTLREMIAALQAIYCRARSARSSCTSRIRECATGCGPDRSRVRPKRGTPRKCSSRCSRTLLEAETFETFLHTRYVGTKALLAEGAESLMVILDAILQRCPQAGVEEICMGMAHRGRLSVLANFCRSRSR